VLLEFPAGPNLRVCPAGQVELVEGVNKHVVGEGLDIVEQQWLVSQINDFLEATGGEPITLPPAENRAKVHNFLCELPWFHKQWSHTQCDSVAPRLIPLYTVDMLRIVITLYTVVPSCTVIVLNSP
jgi:hypothetical protein